MNILLFCKNTLIKNTSFTIFILLIIILGILTNGSAIRLSSIQNLFIAESIRTFAAFGVGLIILTRGIDLSIGQVLGFSACVAASLAQVPEYSQALYPGLNLPIIFPVLVAGAIGTFFGLANGLMIAKGNIPPFIATLGTMTIAWGAKLIYTSSSTLGSVKPAFKALAQSTVFFSIPVLIVYMFILFVVIWFILNYTRLGRYIYAIGGNPNAAKVSGIKVAKVLTKTYAIAGLLYGLGGALMAGRLGMASPLTGNNLELDAIAAVTVGGISHSGGIGTAGGMFTGVLILGLINFSMTYLGVDPSMQLLVKGFIIIVAVYFDMRKHR